MIISKIKGLSDKPMAGESHCSLSLVCASVVVARGGGVRVILLADFLPARWDGRALVVSPRSLCASSNPNIHPQARLMELNYPPEWGERQIARLHVPCCIYKCAVRFGPTCYTAVRASDTRPQKVMPH
jgi:hypothetical protein